jgi:pyridoxine 5-phosphate synthase
VGADMVELHTGTYANAKLEKDIHKEYKELFAAAEFAHNIGLKIAAGHGLNYFNTQMICKIPHIKELSIGHSIIARSSLVGLDRAVRDMLQILQTSK